MRVLSFLIGFFSWGIIFWFVYGRGLRPFIKSARDQASGMAMERLFGACFLAAEVLLQGLWVAYCARRSMGFVPEIGKPLSYGLGFLACQVPLAMVARSEPPGALYHILRSVIPMGLFPAFVLNPHWMLMYQWAIGKIPG